MHQKRAMELLVKLNQAEKNPQVYNNRGHMLSAITAVCCWSVGCNTGGKV